MRSFFALSAPGCQFFLLVPLFCSPPAFSTLPAFVPLSEKGRHVSYMGYSIGNGFSTTFKSSLFPAASLANADPARIIEIFRSKVVSN